MGGRWTRSWTCFRMTSKELASMSLIPLQFILFVLLCFIFLALFTSSVGPGEIGYTNSPNKYRGLAVWTDDSSVFMNVVLSLR